MRLKTVFLAGMGLCSGLALLVALVVVVQEWRHLKAVDQAAAAATALSPALSVSERLALERGGYNEALFRDAQASAAGLTILERLRTNTDNAFDSTFAALRVARYPEAERHATALQAIHGSLAKLRVKAQTEIARPKAERDPVFVSQYAQSVFDVTGQVTSLQAGIEMAIDRVEPHIGQYAGVARVIGLLRDFAGRKQTLYVQILSGGRSVDPEMERLLADADARIDVLWNRALTMISLSDDPRLVAMAETVGREYFAANTTVYNRIHATHPASAGWPGDVASFRAWGVPTLQAILKLRDAALDVASEGMIAQRNEAIADLGIGLGVAVVVVLTASSFAIYFSRAVVYPLTRIESAVTEIAAGNLSVEVPQGGRAANEIGRVAGAVDTLRRKLIETGDERDEREEQLRSAKAAAEEASRAKSQFLANMSHELRTPLNAIIGFADLMLNELFGPLSARYRGYIADIQHSGKHLLDVISDVLDFATIEAGHLRLEEECFALRTAIEASLHMVEPRAKHEGIEIDSRLNVDFQMRGDERRVRQVLLNLLSNAVKFTPRGGRIDVEAWRDVDGEIAIAVRDTGIGIAEDDLTRVLEIFVQAENATSKANEGTGLGLPLTKSLVEAMGGRLTLQSEVGVGTVATVRLPRNRVIDAASTTLGVESGSTKSAA